MILPRSMVGVVLVTRDVVVLHIRAWLAMSGDTKEGMSYQIISGRRPAVRIENRKLTTMLILLQDGARVACLPIVV